MNLWIAGINQTAVVALAALLNTLWYAAAVVGMTWVTLRYLRRVNAATRYWIWTAVLGFLVLLPFLPALASQLETPGSAAVTVAPLATVSAGPQAVQHFAPITITLGSTPGSNHWPLYLLALWMVIAAWQSGLLLRGVVSVKRIKAHAKVGPAIGLPVQPSRKLKVLASDEIRSPVAVGYIHPAVILPIGLPAGLEKTEMRDVLLHEIAHLARYDDWLNLALRALGALLVLHPLAAIVLWQIEREREMACDDFVVAHTGSARRYAQSLARLHDLRSTKSTRLLAPTLLGRKVSLPDRIESLLRSGRNFSAQPSMASLGVGALLLTVLLGAGGLIPGWIAVAQTNQAPRLSFATASVESGNPENGGSGYTRGQGGKLDAAYRTLESLISLAYGVRPDQLEGLPAWAKSRRYTIHATAPPGVDHLPPVQMTRAYREMFQSLLADRFKLKAHRETRILPAYDLVVATGGPRLKPASTNSQAIKQALRAASGCCQLGLRGVSTDQLAQVLSRLLGRTVVDKTGLTDRYDLGLTWKPTEGEAGIIPTTDKPYNPSIIPSVKQQLGLDLKPAMEPVVLLVVDHVEPLITDQ